MVGTSLQELFLLGALFVLFALSFGVFFVWFLYIVKTRGEANEQMREDLRQRMRRRRAKEGLGPRALRLKP